MDRIKHTGAAIGDALYGTDHNETETWFCWRAPLGCPGKLVTLVYEDIVGREVCLGETHDHIPMDARPVLLIPFGLFYREKERFFGIHTRPFMRSTRAKEFNTQRKGYTKAAARERREGDRWSYSTHETMSEFLSGFAEDYDLNIAAAMMDVLVTVDDSARQRNSQWEYHILPCVVQCLSCRATSRIPAIRGAKTIVSGRFIK